MSVVDISATVPSTLDPSGAVTAGPPRLAPGYVQVARHEIDFLGARDLEKLGAWTDLKAMAAFRRQWDPHAHMVLERGDVAFTVRTLATRWGWSVGKTHRFVDSLVRGTLLNKIRNGKWNGAISVYRVVNYDVSPPPTGTNGTLSGTAVERSRIHLQEVKREEGKKESEREGDGAIALRAPAPAPAPAPAQDSIRYDYWSQTYKIEEPKLKELATTYAPVNVGHVVLQVEASLQERPPYSEKYPGPDHPVAYLLAALVKEQSRLLAGAQPVPGAPRPFDATAFQHFWTAYPRKAAQSEAFEAWHVAPASAPPRTTPC